MIGYVRERLAQVHEDRNGQSVIFVTLSMFTLFLFVAMAYNAGSFISSRIRAQTAADASALSGAAWMARSLNLGTALNIFQSFHAAHMALETRETTGVSWTCAIPYTPFIEICAEQTADLPLEVTAVTGMNEAVMAMFVPPGLGPFNLGLGGIYIQIATSLSTLFIAQDNGSEFAVPLGGSFPYILPNIAFTRTPDTYFGAFNVQYGTLDTNGLGFLWGGRYPDNVFMFAGCWTLMRDRAPLMGNRFVESGILFGNGFITVAQARPFMPPWSVNPGQQPALMGADRPLSNKVMNWDVKLMPVTIDNQILGIVPILGQIAGVVTDFVLVH